MGQRGGRRGAAADDSDLRTSPTQEGADHLPGLSSGAIVAGTARLSGALRSPSTVGQLMPGLFHQSRSGGTTMKIDRSQVIDLLRTRGESIKVTQAEDELPVEVDTTRDADILARLGLDLMALQGWLAGTDGLGESPDDA